jgi:hypothetical protein
LKAILPDVKNIKTSTSFPLSVFEANLSNVSCWEDYGWKGSPIPYRRVGWLPVNAEKAHILRSGTNGGPIIIAVARMLFQESKK